MTIPLLKYKQISLRTHAKLSFDILYLKITSFVAKVARRYIRNNKVAFKTLIHLQQTHSFLHSNVFFELIALKQNFSTSFTEFIISNGQFSKSFIDFLKRFLAFTISLCMFTGKGTFNSTPLTKACRNIYLSLIS